MKFLTVIRNIAAGIGAALGLPSFYIVFFQGDRAPALWNTLLNIAIVLGIIAFVFTFFIGDYDSQE